MKSLFKAFSKAMSTKKYMLWGLLTLSLIWLEGLTVYLTLNVITACSSFLQKNDLTARENIIFAAAYFLLAVLLRSLIQFILGSIHTSIYLDKLKYIKNKIADQFHSKFNYHKHITSGDYLFYANEGPEISSQFFGGLLSFGTNFLVGLSLFYLLWRESSFVSIALILCLVLFYVLSSALSKRLLLAAQAVNLAESQYNQSLYEDISGRKDIIGLHLQPARKIVRNFIVDVFSFALTARDKLRYAISSTTEISNALFLIVGIIAFTYLRPNQTDFSIQLMGIFIILQRLASRASALSGAYSQIREGWPAIQRIKEIIAIDLKDNTTSTQTNFPIYIKKLSFQYLNSNFILDLANIKINAGSWIGLSGQNGSGKSTLAQVISGYLPTEFISNPSFIYLSSDPTYFSVGLTENILAGSSYDDLNLKKIIHICCLDNLFVDYNLQTTPNEEFSTGQKQKLGIARALYKNPSLLVLDESLSSIDANSSRSILEAIRCEYPNLCVILVSHDENLLAKADEIWEVENGKVLSVQFNQKSNPNPPEVTV